MLNYISAAFAGTVAEHVYVTTYGRNESSRRSYCPIKSWLSRTNATGRNDLQTAKTIIPRKKSCSRYATIDDFSCTETQADGSYSEGIPKRLFFFLRCREAATKQQQQQKLRPNEPGGRARFFSFYLFIHLFYLFYLFNSISLLTSLKDART